MDTTAIIEAEDRAWAEMHGIELEEEFCRQVGALATPRPKFSLTAEHTEHRIERIRNANWTQFADPGTQIVRGTE